eukprot:CAMPEP_0184329948 /NCGR_PEP_ID=MMETSP1049-20130417/144413_1 /TAXON_ID=77928 /ORGANISM="Proteomonas sulcata, Strain CCMP704" /LENGTH=229 /DNA_ID=CAMNT_0026652339 /DNA_START=834 /DNA_END=1523 /DNA_ORIENTATION=+
MSSTWNLMAPYLNWICSTVLPSADPMHSFTRADRWAEHFLRSSEETQAWKSLTGSKQLETRFFGHLESSPLLFAFSSPSNPSGVLPCLLPPGFAVVLCPFVSSGCSLPSDSALKFRSPVAVLAPSSLASPKAAASSSNTSPADALALSIAERSFSLRSSSTEDRSNLEQDQSTERITTAPVTFQFPELEAIPWESPAPQLFSPSAPQLLMLSAPQLLISSSQQGLRFKD